MVLAVASGTTRQIASGSTVYANQVDLAGEINLSGTLTTDDALVSASGIGEGLNYVFDFDPLAVASGDTFTVASGETSRVGQINLAGELNLEGDLQTVNTTATATPQRLVDAAGSGDATGAAIATPQKQPSASGVGEGIGMRADQKMLSIASGTTETIESGEVTSAGEINLSGELNLTGELQARKAENNALRLRLVAASGIGEGLNYVFDFDPLAVASGDTFTVNSGETTRVGQINLAGELNLEGDLQTVKTSPTATPQRLVDAAGSGDGTGAAIATPQKQPSASGIGEGIGTADALPRQFVSAAGIGEATASNPTFLVSIPLVRGNADGIDWHEDNDIDLGADSDGTR